MTSAIQRVFSVARKVGGVLPRRVDSTKVARWQREAESGRRMALLKSRPEWKEFESLMGRLTNDVMAIQSRRNAAIDDLILANHQMELLKKIELEIADIIERGMTASDELAKLSEKRK